MEDRRHLLLPIALYGLAGGAFALTLLAIFLAQKPAPAPWGQQAKRAYLPAATGAGARHSKTSPRYSPSARALTPRPTDLVRRVAGPLALPVLPSADWIPNFQVVTVSTPAWTATGDPSWEIAGVRPEQLGQAVGVWLSQATQSVSKHVDFTPVVQKVAATLRPTSNQPELTPKVVVGPGDRLAMTTRAPGNKLPPNFPPASPATKKPAKRSSDLTPSEACAYDCVALKATVASLRNLPAAKHWANTALTEIDRLVAGTNLSDSVYREASQRLAEHAQQGRELADSIGDNRTAVQLRKASYAIERRVFAWQIARRLEQRRLLAQLSFPATNLPRMERERVQPESWRAHLRLIQQDSLVTGLSGSRSVPIAQIARTNSALFGPLASADGITPLVPVDPINVPLLISELEQYELKPRGPLAQRIAMRQSLLRNSGAEDHLQLASRIEQDYRNANLRIAISKDLLQRQVPQPEPSRRSVRDRVAGTPVRGNASTSTTLTLDLTPDPHAWKMVLKAQGLVQARTVADAGVARVHSLGSTHFRAEKAITLHPTGVHSPAAECSASSHNRLTGLRTNFDGIPLVGGFARSRAQQEFHANLGVARRRSEDRVASQVRKELNQQSAVFLERAQANYQSLVIDRAENLGVDVKPIEVRTTADRLIARLRIANRQQLGAHTPRNRAPSDSVLSVQMHESLMNNALAGLDVAGQTLTPCELRDALLSKLQAPQPTEALADDTGAKLVLSAEQPFRVALQQGRVDLVLSFRELSVANSRFRNFKVHSLLTPTATMEGVWLTQEEPVQIEGRIRSAKRAKLHAVFSKAMPAGKRFTLMKTTSEQREKLAGLMVTQLLVDDGWIGIAVGPGQPGRIALKERFVR